MNARVAFNSADAINKQLSASIEPDEFDRVLDCLKSQGGFDFCDYHRPHLARQVVDRMYQLNAPDVEAYIGLLGSERDESIALCQTIWIGVTDFFRDPLVWELVREETLPHLLACREGQGPLRIWSAGCASGQEAYSLGMLAADILGLDKLVGRVEIVATDVNATALAYATRGIYSDAQISAVPQHLRDLCFVSTYAGWRMRDTIRRVIRFRRQSILDARPPGPFDLIVCRNVLFYLRPEAQSLVLERMRRNIAAGGCLLLGRGECPFFHDEVQPFEQRFTRLDLKARLYGVGPIGADGIVAGAASQARDGLRRSNALVRRSREA